MDCTQVVKPKVVCVDLQKEIVTDVDTNNNPSPLYCSVEPEFHLWGECEEEDVEDFFEINGFDQWNIPSWVNMCQDGDKYLSKYDSLLSVPDVSWETVYSANAGILDNDSVVTLYTLIENGGCRVDISTRDDNYWENLSDYVSIDTSLYTCGMFGDRHGCVPPVAMVDVGPGCYLPVFDVCVEGVCQCTYTLCGALCQLKPCRFTAAVMGFRENISADDLFVLTFACRGARIVDKNCMSEYNCKNYSSILGKKVSGEMTIKVAEEASQDKIRKVDTPPRCVHALGAVKKPNGSLRPVTDCSQPDKVNINEFMETTCKKFRYKTVDNVVELMNHLDWGAVSDIASAYRGVHMLPSHRKFQGFQLDSGGGSRCYIL